MGSLEDEKQVHAIHAKMKESEERYRLLTENSWQISSCPGRRFIYTNRTTITTSGIAMNSTIEHLGFVHPDDPNW